MAAATAPKTSLRDRHKQQIRRRIVESALSLAATRGLDGVTADQISAEADVGRATFFRYFESKEAAVIVGFYEERLTALVAMLARAPARLGPMDAVIWTFGEMERPPARQLKLLRLQARMVTTSPALRAKAFEYHSRYQDAIARAVAPRFGRVREDDLRPTMLAAATLAVVQAAVDHWAASRAGGDPSKLVMDALSQLKAGFAETA